MAQVGYPDGHCFKNMVDCEIDRYSTDQYEYNFNVGDIVEFPLKVQTGRRQYKCWIVRGRVSRVNKRSVSVEQMVQIDDTEKPASLSVSGIMRARVPLPNALKMDKDGIEEYSALRGLGNLPPIQFDQLEDTEPTETETVDNSDLDKLRRLRNLKR